MCDRQKDRRNNRDVRFEQLMALASEGDECAAGDLYQEYGVDFGRGSK